MRAICGTAPRFKPLIRKPLHSLGSPHAVACPSALTLIIHHSLRIRPWLRSVRDQKSQSRTGTQRPANGYIREW